MESLVFHGDQRRSRLTAGSGLGAYFRGAEALGVGAYSRHGRVVADFSGPRLAVRAAVIAPHYEIDRREVLDVKGGHAPHASRSLRE